MSYGYLKLLESIARTYARFFNKVFSKGHGVRVRDSQGDEYIDCLAVAGVVPLRHNHAEIKQAIDQYISSDGIQQTFDFSTPKILDRFEQAVEEAAEIGVLHA